MRISQSYYGMNKAISLLNPSKPVCLLAFQVMRYQELNMMRLSKELKRLKAAGKTVYVVTHDYEFINECCDSVIRLA